MTDIDFSNVGQTPNNTSPITGNELLFGAPSRAGAPIVYQFPFTTNGTVNPIASFYGLVVGRNNFNVTDGSVTNISVSNDCIGINTATPDGVLTVSRNGSYTNNLLSLWNNSNVSTQPTTLNIGYGSGLLLTNGSINVYNNSSPTAGKQKPNTVNLNSDGVNGLSISASNAAGYISVYSGGSVAANEALRVFPSGNVYIGYGSSVYSDSGKNLSVNGNVAFGGGLNITGALNVVGNAAFSGITTVPTPSLSANDTEAVNAAWVLGQGYSSGSLTISIANGLYVKQGGGIGQLTNPVYIGWSGSRLKATVTSTDLGNFAMETADNTFTGVNSFASTSITTSGSTQSLSVYDTGANGAGIGLNGNGSTTPNKFIRAQTGNLQIINSAYTSTIFNLSDSGALSIPSTMTASSFNGSGSGLTGTAAGLSIGGNAATASNGGVTSVNGNTGDVNTNMVALATGITMNVSGQVFHNTSSSLQYYIFSAVTYDSNVDRNLTASVANGITITSSGFGSFNNFAWDVGGKKSPTNYTYTVAIAVFVPPGVTITAAPFAANFITAEYSIQQFA